MSETVPSALSVPEAVLKRLADESVIWLTTVDRRGGPVPTPVWFLWSDASFLIFSQPHTSKLANITARPRVALNLEADRGGGHVAVFTGTAAIGESVEDDEWARYVGKYEAGMRSLDYGPETFRADYSVPLRVTPLRFRGW
ncbi:TIGR03667 family PPOX class F420-dependent oxidoreductase [Rhodococcus sp. NPDC047139]|uniref:TIGR03667 family PPOX class F420-dependent oxidoreductase n=1 Tax=Rhodococcus sp. NPDC047139 TaxID=3155141 RepID=UPI00340F61AA